MTATSAQNWVRATRQHPCPICGKDHYCSFTSDGLLAGCMDVREGSRWTKQTDLGEMYLHRLTDEPREAPPPRPKAPEAPQRNVIADRAVYALVLATCAPLPDFAEAELVRRFGSLGPQIATERRIGYCDGPALLAAIDAAGRRREAVAAGVLNQDGTVSRSLLGRLVIFYLRDGLVHDLRGAGIKGRGDTKELSLRGGYAERGVDDLFYNDDALGQLGPDATLHLAGGSWKTMGLLAAGLTAAGLRGEAELSDGHIARLREAGVRRVIVHIDAEDPKDGQALSAGRRLGLQKAEKLAAAGFAVLIAEPPREPGTPKVDPDALLRDLGVRAVRDYAYSAIDLPAWRVVIGVAPVAISEEAATAIETWKQRCAKQQRTLSNVIHIRKNGDIKAERDTLTASVLHIAAAQEAGRATPAGRIRQPLYVIAESVGKEKPTVSKHLKLGKDEGLFERELLEEVLVREVDEATGETHTTLRLKDASGRIVEECPAEPVLGAALAYRHATGEEATGAYYVTPKHEPTEILDILVTLKPDRGEKKDWGGKRVPCPHCHSLRRRTQVTCADCGLEFSNKVDEPAPGPDTVADIPVREGEPESIPPTPVEALAATPTYPAAPISYHATASGPVRVAEQADEDEPADDWDPHFCNYLDQRGQQCTARIDPALGKRYCWQHQQTPSAPPPVPHGAAAFTLGGVRVGPPPQEAPPLDPAIAGNLAGCHDAADIAARLARLRERWAVGDRTPTVRAAIDDWEAIAVARAALDAHEMAYAVGDD